MENFGDEFFKNILSSHEKREIEIVKKVIEIVKF